MRIKSVVRVILKLAVVVSCVFLGTAVASLAWLPFSSLDRSVMLAYIQVCLNVPVAVASAALVLTGVDAIHKFYDIEAPQSPAAQGKIKLGGKRK
jgi:hypothetical protein